jgi:tetratricopeptide (TPR) repeat protein
MSSRLGAAPAVRAYRAVVRGTGVKMKQDRRSPSVSDKTFSWVMRLGVMVLAIGVGTFGFMYYQDQHVDAGPTLTGRQIAGAEAAVKKTPNNIQFRLQLAAAYMQDKRLDDAIGQYDEILKADKTNRPALLGRGQILVAKGDLAAATLAYHKITDVAIKGEFAGADSQSQEAHYYLGSIAIRQGKTGIAITELQSALKIDPTDSDALYLMGVARLKEGSTQLAVDSLKQALLFVPTGWCEPDSQLTVAYGKLGNAPKATYFAAMANFCHRKPVEAKTQLKTLLKGPAAVDALLGLALIAETESSTPEAVTWYKQVLTVDRKNAEATAALTRLGAGPTSSPTTQGPTP